MPHSPDRGWLTSDGEKTNVSPAGRPWYAVGWRRRNRARLPMNSDIEIARNIVGVPVVVRIRPHYLVVAALGGALGAGARFVLAQTTPIWQTVSAGTVMVNILGPFLLGAFLQAMAERPETRNTRFLRLLVAVGFLGALTSYAQLAVDVVIVAENHRMLLAVGYGVATLIAGAGSVWLGILTSKYSHRLARRHGRQEDK